MLLSVAICTWNRAGLLRQTLEGLSRLRIPEGVRWELLVVNNNSTDETDQVVASWRGKLPVRELHESRPGKSNALNLAVQEALGEYILFTDDDVLVDPDWLVGYHEAFRAHPDAAIFGGPILPWFAGNPPAWLARTFHLIGYAFASLDLGPAPIQFAGHNVPFGANMALRMKEQRRYRYNPELGPRPGSALRGEEITLVKAMMAGGLSGWWVPGAKVRHYIPEHRQTVSYVRGWYQGWGDFLARDQAPPPARFTFLGRPLWLWRQLVTSEARYLVARVVSPPEVWVQELTAAGTAQGRFASYRR
jgi:glycosyltransferase involved in cell wall biosynthesis